MSCTIVCIQPSPSNAHCAGECHNTFGTVSAFDRHRRDGQCLDPATLRMHRDDRGVWRWDSVGQGPSARNGAPQTADSPLVGVIGRPEASGPDLGRFWGEHPAHPTCVDVTTFGNPVGSEWRCGAECPVIADAGIGASIVILDEPGGAA